MASVSQAERQLPQHSRYEMRTLTILHHATKKFAKALEA
jgi:hypothetical protein